MASTPPVRSPGRPAARKRSWSPCTRRTSTPSRPSRPGARGPAPPPGARGPARAASPPQPPPPRRSPAPAGAGSPPAHRRGEDDEGHCWAAGVERQDDRIPPHPAHGEARHPSDGRPGALRHPPRAGPALKFWRPPRGRPSPPFGIFPRQISGAHPIVSSRLTADSLQQSRDIPFATRSRTDEGFEDNRGMHHGCHSRPHSHRRSPLHTHSGNLGGSFGSSSHGQRHHHIAVRETRATIPSTIHFSASTLPSFQVFPSAISGFTPIVVPCSVPYPSGRTPEYTPKTPGLGGWKG